MKCNHPQTKRVNKKGTVFEYEHRCGQCRPCRITKKQSTSARLFLESLMYPDQAAFVTLTYSDEYVPADGSIRKNDAVLFRRKLQRLLKKTDHPVNMVTSAEYGDYGRPHFHLAIYGIPLNLSYSEADKEYRSKYDQICKKRRHKPVDFPDYERLMLNAWDYKGYVNVGMIEMASASYITKYVVKSFMETKRVPEHCIPEYVTWSRKFAPGRAAANYIADCMMSRKLYPMDYPNLAKGNDWKPVDWEGMAQVEGKKLMLDRYMKNKVIEIMGGDGRTDDQKLTKNFAKTVAARHRPANRPENRHRPIIEVRLTEKEKQRREEYRVVARMRRHAKNKRMMKRQ